MDKFNINIMDNSIYELLYTGIYKPARYSYFNRTKFYFFQQTILEQFHGDIFDANELLLALYTYFLPSEFSITYKMINSFFDEKNNYYTFNFRFFINDIKHDSPQKFLLSYQKIYRKKN